MSWLDGWKHRIRALLNPGGHERELQEEIGFHVELDAMHQRDRDRARRRFGNRTYYQEETRRMTWPGSLDVLRQDLSYGWRSIRRTPGFTLAVVLTLSLGLGVNMAMFSFLDVVFLRPPAGVHEPEQVRRVWTEHQFRSGAQFWSGFSYPQYAAIRSAVGDRVATALYRAPEKTRFGRADEERQIRISHVNASYFRLLGIRPSLGRFFTDEEDRVDAEANVVVASHDFWRRQLGGEAGNDGSALGREVLIAGRRYVLIGVAAEGFSGVELDAADLWLPLATGARYSSTPWWRDHRVNGFQILLRPSPGSGVSDRALEQRIAMGLRTPEALMFPRDTANVVRVGSIIRARGPGNKEQEVRIATRLAAVTIIVLLIACANVINLLLARAVRRRREIAVRLALGISRSRLVRLLLTESVLLATLAAAAAVVAAYWGGTLLRTLLLPDVNWAGAATPLHWRVVVLAALAGIGAGLVAGLLPAMQSARTELTGALKAGGTSDGHARRSRVRAALVVAQAALSVVLLVGAGLFVLSLNNVRGLRIGFDTGQIVFGGVQFDTRDSLRDARQPQAFKELAERIRRAPGVEHVALARMTPTRGFSMLTFYPDVDTTRLPKPFATYNLVTPKFFAATGMRLLRGRDFPQEAGSAMPPVVVVNDAMARAQWPGMDVVGRCLRFAPDGECYTIIGVVETAFFDKLIEEPQAQYYLPLDNPPAEAGTWFSSLIVRAQPRARDVVSADLRRALREAFPGGRPSLSTMEQLLEPEYRPWRLGATLFSVFGLLALIVAAVGIYSTVAYSVAQRTHEFGVRAALGARIQDILRQVIGGSLRTVAIGVAVGIMLAIAGGRFIAALLYGITPGDPGVMIGVSTALLVVAGLAALVPAWRAARVDPVTALRAE